MYSVGKYFSDHSQEIEELRNHGAAFDNATRLVAAALKSNGLPKFILENQEAKQDLVNWIIDGTTSDPDKMSSYNQGIAVWGSLLINYYDDAVSGNLFCPMVFKISNGAKFRDRDATTLHQEFVIPAFILNPDVQDAIDRTKDIQPKLNNQSVKER